MSRSLADPCATPTFEPPRILDVGTNALFITTADLNRDGKFDLVAVTTEGASVLLSNGDGTFQAAVNYRAGTNPAVVVAADLNHDGKPDLAVLNQGNGPPLSDSTVSVFLGNGDGTFRAAVNYAAGTDPGGFPGSGTINLGALAAGDFNADGTLDLAVANEGDGLTVLYGKGDGTFASPIGPNSVEWAASLAVGDFNGNGRMELVIGGEGVSVMEPLTNNTFRTALAPSKPR